MDPAAQLVEALGRFAPRAGPGSVASLPHFLLHELELLDGDQRLVRRLGGLDSLLGVAADQRSLSLLETFSSHALRLEGKESVESCLSLVDKRPYQAKRRIILRIGHPSRIRWAPAIPSAHDQG